MAVPVGRVHPTGPFRSMSSLPSLATILAACVITYSVGVVSAASWYHSVLARDTIEPHPSDIFNTSAVSSMVVHIHRFNDSLSAASVHLSWSNLLVTPQTFGLRRRDIGGGKISASFYPPIHCYCFLSFAYVQTTHRLTVF